MFYSTFKKIADTKAEYGVWSIHITWSTCPPKDWIVARNTLKETDLQLTLSMNDRGWVLQLESRNDVFLVQWRESGMTAESSLLKFRKMIKWPTLDSLEEIPSLVERFEDMLKCEFHDTVLIDGTFSDIALDDNDIRRQLDLITNKKKLITYG